jgi:putative ABC transport system ATP-binding protein
MNGLELREVVKHYEQAEVIRAVDGVTLAVAPGEVVALYGPSGSGKSTLLRIAAGIELPDSGTATVAGQNLAELPTRDRARLLRSTIGLIPQGDGLLSDRRALANAAVRLRADGVPRAEAQERAMTWLMRLGVSERADHYPGQLSGGQRQRVAIARALVTDPHLVLADEPTGQLDRRRGEEVVQILASCAHERGACVVIVTHDERLEPFVDRVEHIEDGRLAQTGSAVVPRVSSG